MPKSSVRPSLRQLRRLARAADRGDQRAAYLLASGWHARGLDFLCGFATRKSPKRAVPCFRQAEALGYLPGTVELGKCLRDGKGIERDVAEAIRCFRRAAEAGWPEAQFELAMTLRNAPGELHDAAESLVWMERACEAGSAEALYELGRIEYAKDGPADAAEALFLRAAQAGHAQAAYRIGWALAIADDDPSTMDEGVKWLEFAAREGVEMAWWHLAERKRVGDGTEKDPEAALALAKSGFHRTGDGGCANLAAEILGENLDRPDLAFRWLRRGAEAGDSDAMISLGCAYRYGRGVRRDLRAAVRCYRAALRVEPDDPNMLGNLSICYRRGEGVPRDLRRAFEYTVRAVEAGNARRRVNLAAALVDGRGTPRDARRGLRLYRELAREDADIAAELAERYLDGDGVKRDVARGLKMLHEAAERGSEDALCSLGVLHYYGRHVPKDHERAADYYRQAVELGGTDALRNLGLCYRDGHGVEQDADKAFECLKDAVKRGCDEAVYDLAEKYLKGDGVPADPARAVSILREFVDDEGEDGDVFVLLARCALDGVGMRRNLREARDQFEMAQLEHRNDGVADKAAYRKLARDLRAARSR